MTQLQSNTPIIFTDKMLDAISIGLKDTCYIHIHEGAIRSSKSVTAITEFFEAVQNSHEVLHCIAAADLDAIRENILYSELGLLSLYSDYCELKKNKIGSYFLEIKCDIAGKPPVKRVLLAGYSSRDKWKKILGKTLGIILIDEINIADKQFVDECQARQASVKNPLQIWTLNGDADEHFIYTEYIDYAKIIGVCPDSIRVVMNKYKKKNGYYYQHWTMIDNPIMTKEKIERTQNIYPVGSYYHRTKILGERGTPGELIFNEYMSNSLIINIRELDSNGRPKWVFNTYTIGIDIGANRAYNSFALIGWSSDYKICCICDILTVKAVGYDKKSPMIIEFVKKHKENKVITCVSVDSAEQNYIADLNAKFIKERLGVAIRGSNKATIKKRIDMNVVGFCSKRVLFDITAKEAFDAFMMAKWVPDKKGIEREDLNQKINDIMDSVEYGQTVHMTQLMTAEAR